METQDPQHRGAASAVFGGVVSATSVVGRDRMHPIGVFSNKRETQTAPTAETAGKRFAVEVDVGQKVRFGLLLQSMPWCSQEMRRIPKVFDYEEEAPCYASAFQPLWRPGAYDNIG